MYVCVLFSPKCPFFKIWWRIRNIFLSILSSSHPNQIPIFLRKTAALTIKAQTKFSFFLPIG